MEVGMKHVIDISEVLGTVDTAEGRCEVCASATAGFDEAAGRLNVKLEAFLRTQNLRAKEKQWHADWLPKPATITEAVAVEEASDVARDIFHRWVRKVGEAASRHPHGRFHRMNL